MATSREELCDELIQQLSHIQDTKKKWTLAHKFASHDPNIDQLWIELSIAIKTLGLSLNSLKNNFYIEDVANLYN